MMELAGCSQKLVELLSHGLVSSEFLSLLQLRLGLHVELPGQIDVPQPMTGNCDPSIDRGKFNSGTRLHGCAFQGAVEIGQRVLEVFLAEVGCPDPGINHPVKSLGSARFGKRPACRLSPLPVLVQQENLTVTTET